MLRPGLTFVFLATLLCTSVRTSASPPLTWQEHLAAGEAILEEDVLRFNEARPHFARALEMAEAAGAEPLEIAHILEQLAETVFLRSSQESEPYYLRALAIREQHLGKDDPSLAPILEQLAEIYGRRGNDEATVALYLRSLKIRESAYGPDDPRTAKPLLLLATHFSVDGDPKLAESYARRALAIAEQTQPPDYILLRHSLIALEEALKAGGKTAEAAALEKRIFELITLHRKLRGMGVDEPE